MHRTDFKALAIIRLADAQALLKARRYAGASYLAGYVIECALKARIAKGFRRSGIPDFRAVDKIYTHGLERIVKIAHLENELSNELNNDPDFEFSWNTIKVWNETRRYETVRSQKEAIDMVAPVSEETHGVFR